MQVPELIAKARIIQKLFAILGLLLAAGVGVAGIAQGKTVRYELTVTGGSVNLSGKRSVDWALLVNGGIPAPTLEFTEGDDAEILVKNERDEEVSIHWHGILLPPEMDGVAYVNTPPILAHKSYTFRFKVRQHGTYWYHSHTMLQEQKGIYGAIVIHPREARIAADRDLVVVLSDWTDENPDQVIRNLRKDGDYYLYKKGSVRSWWGAIQKGALGTYLGNEWTRMGGMDLSDVGYDAFLMNGKRNHQLLDGKPGEKVRIRIVNAAASTYFYVSLGNESMRVVSSDGVDIEPMRAKSILMGMAETYDLVYEIQAGKNLELRATAQDAMGFASGWIGVEGGEKIPAPAQPAPDLYASMDGAMGHAGMDHASMDHGAANKSEPNHGKMDHSQVATPVDHSKMDHHKAGHGSVSDLKPNTPPGSKGHQDEGAEFVDLLTVNDLRSLTATAFAPGPAKFDLKLVLGGDMSRYVWHLNGKAIHEDRTITIREGDIVRFTLQNETMMHHPMHFHGHFFRVLNDGAERSPLKHTVDVLPHGTRTIEFRADEPGEWMLHCHNLYHMKTGMARVVKYSNFTPKPEVAVHQPQDPHLHDHIYFSGMVEVSTNHAQLDLHLMQTWANLELHMETRGYKATDHVEGSLLYRRWFSNFLSVTGGVLYETEFENDKTRGVVGLGYKFPMLVESNVTLDHKGKLGLELEKRFQWTSVIISEVDVIFRQELKPEFELSLMYGPSWSWSAGLMVTEEDIGVGARYHF